MAGPQASEMVDSNTKQRKIAPRKTAEAHLCVKQLGLATTVWLQLSSNLLPLQFNCMMQQLLAHAKPTTGSAAAVTCVIVCRSKGGTGMYPAMCPEPWTIVSLIVKQ